MTFMNDACSSNSLVQLGCEDVCSSSSRCSVSFSHVDVHEHAMTLGVSPSTGHGPPIKIEWDEMDHFRFEIDDYESSRPTRRVKEQMLMPASVREGVLMESGYSMGEIEEHLQKFKQDCCTNGQSAWSRLPIRAVTKAKKLFMKALNHYQ